MAQSLSEALPHVPPTSLLDPLTGLRGGPLLPHHPWFFTRHHAHYSTIRSGPRFQPWWHADQSTYTQTRLNAVASRLPRGLATVGTVEKTEGTPHEPRCGWLKNGNPPGWLRSIDKAIGCLVAIAIEYILGGIGGGNQAAFRFILAEHVFADRDSLIQPHLRLRQ